MQFNKFIVSVIIIFSFYACKKSEIKISVPEKIQIDKILKASIVDYQEEKIQYFLDGKLVGSDKTLSLDIANEKLGKHILKVTVGEKEDVAIREITIIFLAATAPKIYKYKVINSHPHDRNDFTQGLAFYKNDLFEGTGQKGASVIKKIDLETGNVLLEQPLAKKYFGEGITILNDKIYQLTWKNKIGFIYDVNTFKTLKTFSYQNSLEGWGLTHNGEQLIKSDGTEKIWFLTPENGKEINHIEVYTNKKRINKINELEYIDGKIYANVWTKNAIIIIDPKNGMVEAIINMKGLVNQLDNKTIADSDSQVLNGVAYNSITQKLYVTGKNWDKIFEIEVVK